MLKLLRLAIRVGTVAGLLIFAASRPVLAEPEAAKIAVEAEGTVLDQELRALVGRIGGKLAASRDEAVLLLKALRTTERSPAGYQVSVRVELVERGPMVLASWSNDPAFARANRNDAESIDDLTETALVVGEADLRRRIEAGLAEIEIKGPRYRFNIHRGLNVDPVRLRGQIADRKAWQLLDIAENAYGLILRARYADRPEFIKGDLAEILKAAAIGNAPMPQIEHAPRQVIVVRCESAPGKKC